MDYRRLAKTALGAGLEALPLRHLCGCFPLPVVNREKMGRGGIRSVGLSGGIPLSRLLVALVITSSYGLVTGLIGTLALFGLRFLFPH